MVLRSAGLQECRSSGAQRQQPDCGYKNIAPLGLKDNYPTLRFVFKLRRSEILVA